jgi:DHA3 family tetracycline resistance protein-like MFS transporter
VLDLRHRPDAYPVYLISSAAWAFFFTLITTVNLVYQVETAGLSPLQLVLVGTVLEGTAFLFEVPTGIVADVYSRRLSVIIGMALTGLGFLIEGFFPVFGAILLAQVVWGTGYTFISGAQEAWIVDEVGEANAGRVLMRGSQLAQVGGLLGVLPSVLLATLALNVPILAGGAGYLLLALFLILRMPETHFQPAPREGRSSYRQMVHTFGEGARLVRGRPILLTLIVVVAVLGAASEGLDRLSTPHLIENVGLPSLGGLDPVVWFGVISVATSLGGIWAVGWTRRHVNTTSDSVVTRWLFALTSTRIVMTLVFALTGSFAVAFAAYFVNSVCRRTGYPIYAAWLNQHIDSRVRATVLSMNGQADALGQIAGGPAIGALGNVSLRAALAASGLLLAPALALYARASRQGREPAAVAEAGATGSG